MGNLNLKTKEKQPFWWLNKESQLFLERGYLEKGDTAQKRIRKIANTAESILGKKGFADKFYDYMSRGFYSLASPVWSNFGTDRGLPISCNGSFVADRMDSILEKTAEVGMMTKHGAGTSAYFGALRGRGASISVGGKSSGAPHFMELFDSVTNVVSQSNVRRGSFAAYLDADHPDIMEFLELREEGQTIQEMSLGVCISDDFIAKIKAGDKEKRKVWARIIKKKFETGYPYLFFTDTVNRNKPQPYKDKNMKIWHSNLCVAPWTQVDVEINGMTMTMPIKTLHSFHHVGEFGKIKVKSFNTETGKIEYKNVLKSVQTSPKAKVLKITDDVTGKSITCTPEHKIWTSNRGYVMAKDLQETDCLVFSSANNDTSKIKIEYLEEEIPVYDITVEDNHNFFGDGILVHNCTETAISNSETESFVCDLASMNLYLYPQWKDTDAVEVLTWFLDAVMTEYIRKISDIPFMSAAYNFAVRQRALGIGGLGWHDLLQENDIAFESLEARWLNNEIWETINTKANSASAEMARELGEPELLKGYGMRNITLLAIAPNVSSSFILGQVSPSTEAQNSNYYVKDLAKGKFTFKNKHLEKVLQRYEKNDAQTWTSILKNGGSVQHLNFLTEHEKNVFKTAGEISQKTVIDLAAQRQKWIDQSQSLNLMIHPDVPAKEVSKLLLYAHEQGIKTLYYQRSANPSQELSRKLMNCVSCEA